MSTAADLLGGIVRFFPNTMIVTLIFGGIALGRIAWVLIGVGAIVLTVGTLLLQFLFGQFLQTGGVSGGIDLSQACSLLPVVPGYAATPSLWVALTTYFLTYILVNATNVYTQRPKTASAQAISVQQRKSVGIISMISVSVVALFLLGPRIISLMPGLGQHNMCESGIGIFLGILVGGGAGYAWWRLLDACGPDFYPDIHGVMLGLKPGALHTTPMACA